MSQWLVRHSWVSLEEISSCAGRPRKEDQPYQRWWALPIRWGPWNKKAEGGEICSLGLNWDFHLLLPSRWGCGDSAVRWFWRPRPGQASRSLQKATPMMFDQGNIFKTVMAHEHQSVLYPNRMAMSNKGLKPTVLQRGLLTFIWIKNKEPALPGPLSSWSSQDNSPTFLGKTLKEDNYSASLWKSVSHCWRHCRVANPLTIANPLLRENQVYECQCCFSSKNILFMRMLSKVNIYDLIRPIWETLLRLNAIFSL